MVQKIALEEHFLCPGLEDYWNSTVEDVPPEVRTRLLARLSDFGEMRLETMDKAGIARAVLSVSGPGVQIERDAQTAIRKAREANDLLAREIQKRPNRYAGFGHLPMQDAAAAADELERCMQDLKFCGAMINGHTNGQYLDDASLSPFWERAEALGTLIYIHPTDPVSVAPVLQGHPGLRRATWEWTFENRCRRHRIGRVQVNQRVQRLDALPKRRERGMIEILAVGVAIDHRAAEFQLSDAALELVGGGLGILHGKMRQA